jgi:hypothetical protein
MKNEFRVILIIALFSSVSCQKEIAPKTENTGMPLITKEIYGNDLNTEFIYNEQNLLKERKSRWFYTLYHYDADNRLTRADLYDDPGIYSSDWVTAQAAVNRTEWVNPDNTRLSGIATYKYNNQFLESITEERIPGDVQNKSTFFYDNNGRIVNRVFYSAGEVFGKIVYSYDVSGNVIKEEQYYGDVLSSTRLLEYDNKHNPYAVFRNLLVPGIYTNENNITRDTQILAHNTDPNIETVQVTVSVYKYNDLGYPVTQNGFIRYEYK